MKLQTLVSKLEYNADNLTHNPNAEVYVIETSEQDGHQTIHEPEIIVRHNELIITPGKFIRDL
jgi:hypothetical protein